nr:MAG: hypothetical protein [uncultured cyanophage]WFD61420.1 MAG: hypothetical protein [uncultured cyanophage]
MTSTQEIEQSQIDEDLCHNARIDDLEATLKMIARGRMLNDQKKQLKSEFTEWFNVHFGNRAGYNKKAMRIATFVDKHPEWEHLFNEQVPEDLEALATCKSEETLQKILQYPKYLAADQIKKIAKIGTQSDATIEVLLEAKELNTAAIAGELTVTVLGYPQADNLVHVGAVDPSTGLTEDKYIDYRFLKDPGTKIKRTCLRAAEPMDISVLGMEYSVSEEDMDQIQSDFQVKGVVATPGEIENILIELGYKKIKSKDLIDHLSAPYNPVIGDRVSVLNGATGTLVDYSDGAATIKINNDSDATVKSSIMFIKKM